MTKLFFTFQFILSIAMTIGATAEFIFLIARKTNLFFVACFGILVLLGIALMKTSWKELKEEAA